MKFIKEQISEDFKNLNENNEKDGRFEEFSQDDINFQQEIVKQNEKDESKLD